MSTKTFRIIVSILFGMVGFAGNFLDIQLFTSPEFRVNILIGLLFPLLITMAWGWRYGLLSALAGGCQSMWWLWQNDGWGIIYAVPVFTLWIVWHGYWADRRRNLKHLQWFHSRFVVELPFRLASELGFYTFFRWLVSFNPPPWNSAITWDHVSLSWVNVVAVKHLVTAYILLLIAHVLLRISVVRRFFKLENPPEQRILDAIYSASLLLGCLLWVLDALAQYLFFNQRGHGFWDVAVLAVDSQNLFERNAFLIVSLMAGIWVARLAARRIRLEKRLQNLNRVLLAIRGVTQLICHEKDVDRLLQRACETLIETRSFHNALLLILGDNGEYHRSYHAGFSENFETMSNSLKNNRFPLQMKKALKHLTIAVVENPLEKCADCPLSSDYGDHSGICVPITHEGQRLGLLTVAVPHAHAHDTEEHALLKELTEDLGFALHAAQVAAGQLKLEEELQQAQKMEAIGTLAGGIAHDFNNILASIIGFTQLALEDTHEKTIKADLQQVLNAGMRAKELVQQILTFARRSDGELKPMRPAPILKEALKLLRSSLPTTIDIKSHMESDITIKSDPTQIHQILMNLCTNAAHAMEDDGGTLRVTLEKKGVDLLPENQKGDFKSKTVLLLTVADTGHGIPPHIIPSIFEPYFTTKPPGKGTGMGLSMVHGIVKSHGGGIVVESSQGKGTCFKIYLPIMETDTKMDFRTDEDIPTGTEKILFVDDESSIVEAGSRILEHLGYQVITQTNSQDALAIFRQTPEDFDGVVTDMTMPHMTGDQLAAKLMEIKPNIPIILCTGYSSRMSPEKARRIGIRAYIHKPLTKTELARTVRKVLDRK